MVYDLASTPYNQYFFLFKLGIYSYVFSESKAGPVAVQFGLTLCSALSSNICESKWKTTARQM